MADYDDNVYPSDGEWFGGILVQQQDKLEEEDKLSQAKPLLQEVMAHLDERIAYLGDVDSVPADLSTEPELHKKIVEHNRDVRATLRIERDYIANLL